MMRILSSLLYPVVVKDSIKCSLCLKLPGHNKVMYKCMLHILLCIFNHFNSNKTAHLCIQNKITIRKSATKIDKKKFI